MKHTAKVTLILISIFLLSQIVGLFFVAGDIDGVELVDDKLVVMHPETAVGERPQFEGAGSLIYISVAVFIGTLLILLLARLKARKVWKFWYMLAVVLAITISLGVFVPKTLAWLLALILMLVKMYKPNVFTHNITELLMYTGLAVLIIPIFDLFWASMLLILISVYDMYAVWKSKHMITLANFTMESNLFAGLSIDYNTKTKKIYNKVSRRKLGKNSANKTAILGGGDVIFPLIFAGVVMEYLVVNGFSILSSYFSVLIISLVTTLSLWMLFYYSKKGRFYPAMPFLSAGCFAGLGLLWIVSLFI